MRKRKAIACKILKAELRTNTSGGQVRHRQQLNSAKPDS